MGVKKRRAFIRHTAEAMLNAHAELAEMAAEATKAGFAHVAILDALARALLFGIWYFEMEGVSDDPNAMTARRFRLELDRLTTPST